MSQPLRSMTFRDKLNEAERLTRELIHHVEHGFIPKARELRRTARHGNNPKEQDQITDTTIRSSVEKVVKSDDFTRKMSDELAEYLKSIDEDMNRIIGN